MSREEKNFLFYTICLTIFIFMSFMLIKHIYPFGKYQLAVSDAYSQYEPFLYDFIRNIKTGKLINYSFKNFLGNPTLFNYIYYLSSPINLVGLFFNSPHSIYFSILFTKIIITSITSYLYFKKYNSKLGMLASVSYTFSGWFLAYYFNIMWLDAFFMLPILQFGLDKLIEKNKPVIYIISLCYILISNFYCAFFMCIYVLVYYLIKIIVYEENYYYKIKNFLIILFSTLLAIGICSFHIYNVLNSFLQIKIQTFNYTSKLNFFDFVGSFYDASSKVLLSAGQGSYTNICSNIFIIMGAFSYFFNKNINKKNRIINMLVLFLWFYVFFSPFFNYVLAGFSSPAGYPIRYSFIFTFYLINLWAKNSEKFYVSKKDYIITFIYLIVLNILYFFNDLSIFIYVLNTAEILLYFIYLTLYKKLNKISKIIIVVTILIVPIFSLCSNNRIHKFKKNVISSYNFNLYDNTYNFNYFSSMSYKEPLYFVGELGNCTNYKSTICDGSMTEVIDVLFGLKKFEHEKIYSVNKDYMQYKISDDFIENNNELVYKMTGIKNIINEEKVNSKTINGITYLKIKKSEKYYFIVDKKIDYLKYKNHVIIQNSMYIDNYSDLDFTSYYYMSLINLNLKKDDELEVKLSSQNDNFKFYTIYSEKLENFYEIVKNNSAKYNYFEDNHFSANILVNKNQIVFTSIPYDTNWKVYVDDDEYKPLKLNGLILLNLPEGEHKLEFKYQNNNKYIYLTLISVLLFIFYIIYVYKKSEDKFNIFY